MRTISFAKGHGTLNDFVVLVDRHNTNPLSVEDVQLLCDRHAGIGADGVLRAVKAEHIPEWQGDPTLWFMDHRNADGSPAAMSGNGARVLVHYLADNDWVATADVTLATYFGPLEVHLHADGSISTEVGPVTVSADPVDVSLGGCTRSASYVDAGNHHCVVMLPEGESVNDLDLGQTLTVQGGQVLPEEKNVAFVQVIDGHHLAVRFVQRAGGEALSSGTGSVAAVAMHAATSGTGDGQYRVEVAGGVLHVTLEQGRAMLKGPSVIVAKGEIQLPDPPDDPEL